MDGWRAFAVDDRAQTTFDFTVGISVFLLVIISVFFFVSSTIEPFNQGGQEDIVTANRVGNTLSEGLLGDPARPHVLNTTCTVHFFNDSSPSYCRYTGSNVTEKTGVMNRKNVNVTIRGDIRGADGEHTICWNDDPAGGRLIEVDQSGCDTRLAIGPSSPDASGTTVTAKRLVSIRSQDVTLRVEVWS